MDLSRDHTALTTMRERLRILLPEEYQDRYEEVKPVSMGSAGLKFAEDGTVAWNEMWASFCDLAMAGGPPHKGRLLEPATPAEVEAEPERYRGVVDELCLGVSMVTDLTAFRSPTPGWIRVRCLDRTMAQWLLRAITIENVSIRMDEGTIDLPASPAFRLDKEIKNVVTVAAKTCHYWMGHTSARKRRSIAKLFAAMAAESTLVEPATARETVDVEFEHAVAAQIGERIHADTGLRPVDGRSGGWSGGWLGVTCPSVGAAIWMMRALLVSNVLARREETTLFVPLNPATDPGGGRVTRAVMRAHGLALASSGVLDQR